MVNQAMFCQVISTKNFEMTLLRFHFNDFRLYKIYILKKFKKN
jgi:hypothetical protein